MYQKLLTLPHFTIHWPFLLSSSHEGVLKTSYRIHNHSQQILPCLQILHLPALSGDTALLLYKLYYISSNTSAWLIRSMNLYTMMKQWTWHWGPKTFPTIHFSFHSCSFIQDHKSVIIMLRKHSKYLHSYPQRPLIELQIVNQWRIIHQEYYINSTSSGIDIWKNPIIVTSLISKQNNSQFF